MLEFDFDFLLSCFDLWDNFDLSSSKMNLDFLDRMCFFDRSFGHSFDHLPVCNWNYRYTYPGFYFEILFRENLGNIRVGFALGW